MSFVREKVALITGGASGIGLAVTKKFLDNGVKGVSIVDISENNGEEVVSNLQVQYGEKVIFIKADVSKEGDLRNAFEETIKKFANLDIVFNNAGITDRVNWERTVDVNLKGVMRGSFLAINEYLPKYKSSDETLLMNTSSIVGINPVGGGIIYPVTKHGVLGLGKALGKDETCRKNKIRVITICPGTTQTPLLPKVDIKKLREISEELASVFEIISSTEYVADAIMEIIDKGEHGSIWVAEREEPPYEVVFPHHQELRKIQ